jgi:hypothetical protein
VDLEFAGDGGASIVLEVGGYERPDATNDDDAQWLSCRVAVRVEPLNFSYPLALRTGELVAFNAQLLVAARDSGKAELKTVEGAFAIALHFNRTGQIASVATCRFTSVADVNVSFAFQNDASYMLRTQRQLDQLLQRFPVKSN